MSLKYDVDYTMILALGAPIFYGLRILWVHTRIDDFFYAIDNAKFANTLIISEAILVVPITFGMVAIVGINGVWWLMALV